MGEIKVSPDYNWFRSTVPLKKIIVDDDDSKIWSLYDAGPRNIRCPLIFLPPVSGTADVFFRQILALTGWGYRVIALQYPVYWDHLEFCDGFRKLLDHLQLDKVHLFGASLGGFLAQKFAEYTHKSPRVHSLILCNSFSDTSIFNQTWTANRSQDCPYFVLLLHVSCILPGISACCTPHTEAAGAGEAGRVCLLAAEGTRQQRLEKTGKL